MTIERRTFLKGAAALSTAGLLATATGAVASGAVTLPESPAPAPGPQEWLSVVPERTALHRLTLPGTHNSGAQHGGPWAECQNTGIDAQLRAGVRFLDIRCRAYEGAFSVHHGPFYQHLNFDDVLGICQDFLRENPSETVLMRLKQEYSSESPEAFRELFDGYLEGKGRDSLFLLDDALPALGRARGKVVLLGDSDGLPGVRYGDDGIFDIQDDYQAGPDRKFGLIEAQFRKAASEPGKLYTNFVSTAALLTPRSNADTLNPRVKKLLSGGEGSSWRGLGIVPMDFPGEHGMSELLIRHNSQLAPELRRTTD